MRDLRDLEAAVERLPAEAQQWLVARRDELAVDPTAIRWRFPEVGRRVGRQPIEAPSGSADAAAWTADDVGRVWLLASHPDADDELAGLYRYGDAAERRAVLHALSLLPVDEAVARPLIEDALRANDLRLIAAALGPAAPAHLDDHAYAHAVLKAVFVGLPLDGVAGLPDRATPQLSRMLARFVHERIAAGRPVPADVWPLIDRFPPSEELAAIEAELDHEVPERASAARAALATRTSAP